MTGVIYAACPLHSFLVGLTPFFSLKCLKLVNYQSDDKKFLINYLQVDKPRARVVDFHTREVQMTFKQLVFLSGLVCLRAVRRQ